MNSLTRWQRPEVAAWPRCGQLTDFQQEIGRLFGSPLTELARTSSLQGGWVPALDLYEDKDNLYVKVELPGMKREEIEVSFQEGNLSVSGERKSEQKQEGAEVWRAERFYGRFQRMLTLPMPVASEKIKAQYQDGILNITLPKAEEAKPKPLDVSVS